ncbi:hypothetical protein ES703_57043 [subsurface metagenome]
MLSPEQVEQIKHQIIQQIDSNFPEDKKESAKQQIKLMSPEQLEEFLEKNKLMKTQQDSSKNQQCIFCSIISGNIQSYKIDENEKAIAVLEINPISKGHTIIIPKEHIPSSEKIPQGAFSLAKKLAKKIKTKLKLKDIKISSSNLFGHEIINILPVYENETLDSKRNQAKPEELEELQKILKEKPKEKIVKKPRTKKLKEKIWLPKRIP